MFNKIREIENECKNLQQSIDDIRNYLKRYRDIPPDIAEAKTSSKAFEGRVREGIEKLTPQ